MNSNLLSGNSCRIKGQTSIVLCIMHEHGDHVQRTRGSLFMQVYTNQYTRTVHYNYYREVTKERYSGAKPLIKFPFIFDVFFLKPQVSFDV